MALHLEQDSPLNLDVPISHVNNSYKFASSSNCVNKTAEGNQLWGRGGGGGGFRGASGGQCWFDRVTGVSDVIVHQSEESV